MKRLLPLLLLVAVFSTAGFAYAGDTVGVYVAPKFIYGLTAMEGIKTKWMEGDEEPFSTKIGDKTDSAFGGALAVGYDFSRNFDVPIRLELEYSLFSKADGDKSRSEYNADFGGGNIRNVNWKSKQSFEIQTLFFNAYYDFDTGTAFTPYVGAGVGAAFIKTKGSYRIVDKDTGEVGLDTCSSSKTVSNFAWNVGIGVGYDINENFTVDLGYRFAGLGGVKTRWADDEDSDPLLRHKTSDLYMHQFMLGLRITF